MGRGGEGASYYMNTGGVEGGHPGEFPQVWAWIEGRQLTITLKSEHVIDFLFTAKYMEAPGPKGTNKNTVIKTTPSTVDNIVKKSCVCSIDYFAH